MSNPFVHIELNTGDLAAAKKFYKKIFDGWSLHDETLDHGAVYTMIAAGKHGIGGMQVKMMPEAPTLWLPYVEVDDVKETMARAQKAGATLMVPFMEIGEMGSIGIFNDPTGATLGVWAAPKKEKKSKKDKKEKKEKKQKKDGKKKSKK